MRPPILALVGILHLSACTYESQGQTSAGASSTTTDASASTTATDPTTSAAPACIPGMSIGCVCPNAAMGAQICNPDGQTLGPCVCDGDSASEGGTTTGSTDSTSTGDDITATSSTTGTTGTTAPDDTTTTGDACPDPGPEPNDIEADAVDLGEQTCNDDPREFTGVLDGPADADWYRYHGVLKDCDGIFLPDPDAAHVLKAAAPVRLCVFATCDEGDLELDCEGPPTQAVSPDGRPGCCNTGDVTFTVSCEDSDNENAQVFVRLDKAPADACIDYTVTYSYLPD